MHVEEAHRAPASFREFVRAYAMIVLSILTALALERAAIYLHDRAAASDSRTRIEQEIGTDLADVREAIAFNRTSVDATQAALHDLIDLLKSGSADKARAKAIIQDAIAKHLNLHLPTWQRDAWDAAIADGSATHLAGTDLQRYTQLYSGARDATEAVRVVLAGTMFDRLAALQVGLQTGDIDIREDAVALTRFLISATQIVETQKLLLAAGNARPAPDAAAPARP